MRTGLAYSRRLWVVAHSLGSVGGVLWRMGQTLGRAAEFVAEYHQDVQRVANGIAICRTWGGCRCCRSGRRRRTASLNISTQAAEQLRTPGTLPAVRLFSSPFKRSLLHIHKTITKQTQFQQSLKGAAEYIYNLHARRIYNILHERAIIILSYTHTQARPPLFFSFFFFFLFLFFFYLFFYLFFYITFLFVCLFAFRRFLFFCFVFLFSLPQFLQPFRRRQGVSLSPLLPLCSPLFVLSIIKCPRA